MYKKQRVLPRFFRLQQQRRQILSSSLSHAAAGHGDGDYVGDGTRWRGARSKRRPPRTRPAFFPPSPGRIRPPSLPFFFPEPPSPGSGRARSRAEEGDGGGEEDGVVEVEAGRATGQGSSRRSKLAARAGGEVGRSAGQGSPRRGKLAARSDGEVGRRTG